MEQSNQQNMTVPELLAKVNLEVNPDAPNTIQLSGDRNENDISMK